jgi:hypothetical protein
VAGVFISYRRTNGGGWACRLSSIGIRLCEVPNPRPCRQSQSRGSQPASLFPLPGASCSVLACEAGARAEVR